MSRLIDWPSKQKEYFMIALSGQGDVDIAFVEADVFDWITMDRDCPERVVEKLKPDYSESDLNTTDGSSPDNDRALMATGYAEHRFFSLQKAMDFVRDNNISVRDTYEGWIY